MICSFIGSQLFGGAILVMEEDQRKRYTRIRGTLLETRISPSVRMGGGESPGFSRGEDVKIRLRYDRLGG